MNKQLIYYYFSSKTGLYAAATGPAAQQPAVPSQATTSSDSAPGAVRAAVAGLMSSLQDRPELVTLLVDPLPSADAHAQARAWVAQATADVAAAISRGQGMGYFRDDLEPDDVAQQALVLCVGFLALRDQLTLDGEQWLRGVTETLLRSAVW